MAEWTTATKMAPTIMNQKTVYVGAAVPATPYDGQIWVCTSSDPPLVKVYDTTNTQWLEHHSVRYETVASGQLPASGVILNGTISVAYDTGMSSTKIFARANGSWRDMGGAITRVYPEGDQNVAAVTIFSGTAAGNWYESLGNDFSGAITVLASTNITPTNSGDMICLFGGGHTTLTSGFIRLFIGTTMVYSGTVFWRTAVAAKGYKDGCPNTSTNIYMDALSYATAANSGMFSINRGVSIGAVSVKT